MTREEYYAGIEAYKNKLEHRAMDANAEDTSGKALENWKNQYLNQAVNLRAKQYLASKSGRTDDASTYEKQLQILLDKMTNLKGVSLSAKQAILQTIDQTATNKANVQFAKHSDEPEDGVLEHGGEWKNHKYIRIENGRYIYPEDLKKNSAKSVYKTAGLLDKYTRQIADLRKEAADNARKDGDKEKAKVQDAIAKADYASANAQYEQAKGAKKTLEEINRSEKKEELKEKTEAVAKSGTVTDARKGSDINNQNKEASSMAGYEEWKKQQEAKKAEAAAAKAQSDGEKRTEAMKKALNPDTKKIADEYNRENARVMNEAARVMQKNPGSSIYTDDAGYFCVNDKKGNTIWQYTLVNPNKRNFSSYDEYKKAQDIMNIERVQGDWSLEKEKEKNAAYESKMNAYKEEEKRKLTAKHSLNLTREEYYAGIEEYKRKKA